MNRFNEVFLAIKKHCGNQKHIAEIDCFDTICKEAHISPESLPMYLNQLKDSGLINYSIKSNFIHLTSFGKQQETLIKDKNS